ncbi:MAG TPA: Hsp20/alpha crystallin family protein [Acidimicrobiales bacterium]|nr:Hsp20/alpha crystallin family protein [Acidimicrobiales bacterium]
MAGLLKREVRRQDLPVDDLFDRVFDNWARTLAFRPLFGVPELLTREALIPVDEVREDGALVIRAEMPGIDPEKDVTITVTDGVLQIEAERRLEEKVEEKGYLRRELRYGTFVRSIALPEGVSDADISATYKDGILQVRVPIPAPTPARTIPVGKD